MTTQAKIVIAALSALSVGLAIVLAVALASNGDDDMDHMGTAGDGYMGMMQAMGGMDSDEMLKSMQGILGPDAFKQMADHMAAHRGSGQAPGSASVDSMMHRMMDGMMQRMPDDSNHMMPLAPR